MFILKGLQRVFTHPLNQSEPIQTLARVVWWKINQLFFRYPALVEFMGKTRMVCYPNNSFGGLVVYTKLPEYEESIFTSRYLRKEDVFIDVGANIGYFSLIAAGEQVSKVYAFEPTPQTLSLLHENIQLNSFESCIEVVPKAVGNQNKPVSFTLTTETEVNHLTLKGETSSQSITVPCTTLDSFVKQKNLSHIAMIKVDVEGAEMLVFQGLKNMLKNKQVEVILFEVNKQSEQFGFSYLDYFDFFEKYEYSLFEIDSSFHLRKITKTWQPQGTPNILATSPKFKRVRKFL
jgi:FkbM family methyltransferase